MEHNTPRRRRSSFQLSEYTARTAPATTTATALPARIASFVFRVNVCTPRQMPITTKVVYISTPLSSSTSICAWRVSGLAPLTKAAVLMIGMPTALNQKRPSSSASMSSKRVEVRSPMSSKARACHCWRKKARTPSMHTIRLGTRPLYTRPPQVAPCTNGLVTFHQMAQLTMSTHCSAVALLFIHARNMRWSALRSATPWHASSTAGSLTPRALSGTSTALSTRSASARVSTSTPRAFATSSPLGGAMPSKKPLPTAISASGATWAISSSAFSQGGAGRRSSRTTESRLNEEEEAPDRASSAPPPAPAREG
mmetsp:Transcript_9401/g.23404  ORF Transcript_9401/g.23404 Transcript_9401/m.23404 type:complete len:311 (+) Transcript_9401:340-1272(+)